MKYINLKVNHPDFYYVSEYGYDGSPVVLFDRNYFGKDLPVPFVKSEIDGMIKAVQRDLVDYNAVAYWGGVSEVYFSVSIEYKKSLRKCKKDAIIISKQHSLPMLFPSKLKRIK